MPDIVTTIEKARSFSELERGWHFGEGVPPSQECIEQAVRFLGYAEQSGITRANAFPGISGQVEVTFYNADNMLEITIETDGSITIAEDSGREQVYFAENRSRFDAYQKIEEFSPNVWLSSDLFIVNITTPNVSGVFQAKLLTSKAGSHFQSWTVIARGTPAVYSAHIYPGFTVNKLAIRQFTGRYKMPIFQSDVELKPKRHLAGMTAIGTFTIGEEIISAKRLRD